MSKIELPCPWGCDPAPCELCAQQEARELYSPRRAAPLVWSICGIVALAWIGLVWWAELWLP
jgi:hypothetical protein